MAAAPELDNPSGPHYVEPMFDPKIIDDLSRRLAESLPPGLATLREDFRRNADAALQTALARLDLVSREEFDVQRAVLARTREKLEALERQLALVEQQVTGNKPG